MLSKVLKFGKLIVLIVFLLFVGMCAYLFRKMAFLLLQNNLLNAKIQSYGESSDYWLK
jgi:hypothetical protein